MHRCEIFVLAKFKSTSNIVRNIKKKEVRYDDPVELRGIQGNQNLFIFVSLYTIFISKLFIFTPLLSANF